MTTDARSVSRVVSSFDNGSISCFVFSLNHTLTPYRSRTHHHFSCDSQILKGLKYVHSANVLHRDLKPSNLLLNSTCDLKICDFGLARSVDENQWLTEYVVTRWYRAPELLLSVSNYSAAVDVWSVGCIVAELLGRKPLFPGHDWLDQLRLVSNVLGTPTAADMDFITSSKARSFLTQPPIKEPCSFATLYPGSNELAIDLLGKVSAHTHT